MKMPFVLRSRFDRVRGQNIMAAVELAESAEALKLARHNLEEMRKSVHEAERQRDTADAQMVWISGQWVGLMEKYHALKLQGASLPEPVVAPVETDEPDVPPDEVLLAMQQISPVRDKTYEANWQHWERNKEKARLHPTEFAEEIILGAVFERDDTTRPE